MTITWNGLGSFSIVGKPISGDVSLITDPYQNTTGLRFPRTLNASIVIQSHDDPVANNLAAVAGEDKSKPFQITHAGEYEIQGIFVNGVRAPKKDGTEHTLYRIGVEGINIGFLGALDRKLTDTELEGLGNIDVLILPVGGGPVGAKEIASEVVQQVEPRLVIPSHFNIPGLKKKLEDVKAFCKELSCASEEAHKIKITKSSLPVDEVQIIVPTRG
ncbi:MBL fold metallo-hydrolase [Patescibacteria group bacterium]|nr:MBL fold metallo-hydrolase [Patescibacteria group bacterium]